MGRYGHQTVVTIPTLTVSPEGTQEGDKWAESYLSY